MNITAWWPRLRPESREWLVAHNGEALDPAVAADLLDITEGTTDPSWWAGESTGDVYLTDEATDWIEAAANGENDEGDRS
ncbi:hypothetical protein [Psychromicrobium xiongbiense]|uniref:hypothetical protein n=1 Tax=Psychromicrobium xiongbiense TaxID=3051184 RepID=UPI0025532787|nr:hypothetical protein [Psychromicrobium sp. YIM S02556]